MLIVVTERFDVVQALRFLLHPSRQQHYVPEAVKHCPTGMNPAKCLKWHPRVASLGLGRFDQTKNGYLKEFIEVKTCSQ